MVRPSVTLLREQVFFADALIGRAGRSGVEMTDQLLSRIFLIEIQARNLAICRDRIEQKYGISFPDANIIQRDVIVDPIKRSFDILIGNPPWANFKDLPHDYKEQLKPYFIDYGLVPDRQAVLFGASGTDIAALVLKVVFHKILRKNGDAYFYAPLSLFTGDDAHIGFRDYRTKFDKFSVKEIFEFSGEKVFKGIGTFYCACHFRKGAEQKFPIPYFRGTKDEFNFYQALPLKLSTDPLRVTSGDETESLNIEVTISPEQKPRQGVNPCGAGSIFIFDKKPDYIASEYLFPLASKEIWRNEGEIPEKWIFLPYDRSTGKPLQAEKVKKIKGFDYLLEHEAKLRTRKGTLIQSAINRGIWWSLLGVGPYSFAHYKVIWESYGKHTFSPIVLDEHEDQPWQGNQAMHAFIPCESYDDALRICEELKCPQISRILFELNGQGKCNFAQPGKIKKILRVSQMTEEQMLLMEPKRKYRTGQ